jgi:8-oxo-dGTP diphosphatase
MTTVTAAVIERDGFLLICRRRADQKHPLKWEFPGGKVEPGEETAAGLRRELREELGIAVEIAEEITRFEYQYPGRPPILLVFYRVRKYSEEIENRIFAEVRWARPSELPQFDFLEGDVDFVRRLAAEGGFAEGGF